MAKNRMVNTDLWEDTWVSTLGPSEKLLFVYLLTNGRTNIIGCYEIRVARIALDTGIEDSMIERVLQKFQAAGKVTYLKGWMIVHNFERHQRLSGEKITEAKKSLVNQLPEDIRQVYRYPIHTPLFSALELSTSSSLSSSSESGDEKKPTLKDLDEQVADFFEQKFELTMPQRYLQLKYARQLHREHGFEEVCSRIEAAAAARGQQYFPKILDLKSLAFKWNDLEDAYLRHKAKLEGAKKPPKKAVRIK